MSSDNFDDDLPQEQDTVPVTKGHSCPQSTDRTMYTTSKHDQDQQSFDILLSQLLASKRSLSTVDLVHQANDLCTRTRQEVEQAAIKHARTEFLQQGMLSQLNVLDRLCIQSAHVGDRAADEYTAFIARLDAANSRLNETLTRLKETIVEAQLRPVHEEKSNLLDFIDEAGVQSIHKGLHDDMEQVNKDFSHFDQSRQRLEETTRQLRSIDTQYDSSNPSISDTFAAMEQDATVMAEDLESLVSHYDLCVTALRHVQGTTDLVGKYTEEASRSTTSTILEPITSTEFKEIQNILAIDSQQVDGIVSEMQDRLHDIESLHSHLSQSSFQAIAARHTIILDAYQSLRESASPEKIRLHISLLGNFRNAWKKREKDLDAQLQEIDNAQAVYDAYLIAYDHLIIEIGRRKAAEKKMRGFVTEMAARARQMRDDDVRERDRFRTAQGSYLPVDLWSGVFDQPWTPDFDALLACSAKSVPDIAGSVILAAIRRIHG